MKLYSGRDSMDAHHVRGLLEAAGVRAVVMGDQLATAWGEVPFMNDALPGVWINDEDKARAAEVMDEFFRDAATPPRSAPWVCPRCGEEVEGQFEVCWNCGTPRPDDG